MNKIVDCNQSLIEIDEYITKNFSDFVCHIDSKNGVMCIKYIGFLRKQFISFVVNIIANNNLYLKSIIISFFEIY
jgi:hypothetical protein